MQYDLCEGLRMVNVWLVADPGQLEMVIGPVWAPTGTIAVSCVSLSMVKLALVPSKRTLVIALGAEKWLPVMTTCVPTLPEVGEMPVMIGAWAYWLQALETAATGERDGLALVRCTACVAWAMAEAAYESPPVAPATAIRVTVRPPANAIRRRAGRASGRRRTMATIDSTSRSGGCGRAARSSSSSGVICSCLERLRNDLI
jgi:hypothetical protein